MTVTETELIYGRAEGRELSAVLYSMADAGPGPLVIDVHGGAWSSGHHLSGQHYDRALARSGIAVLAIEFRHGPEWQHPSASSDIAAAVRFARTELERDITSIGLAGSSSGGHLAFYTALLPDRPVHGRTEIRTGGDRFVLSDTSAAVDFVIGLWPVSNPLARYQYVLSRVADGEATWGPNFTPDRLAAGTRQYFVSQREMDQASIPRLVSAGEYDSLPRIMIVQPELDLNVPVFINQTLHGALLEVGCDVTYCLYPGVAHGFAAAPGAQTDRCHADMVSFIDDGSL